MKKVILLITAWIFTINSFAFADALWDPCSLPEPVNHFINCFAERQKENRLILVTKDGELLCDCLERVALMFDYFAPVTLEEARQLILGLVTSFLQEINQQEKLKKNFCTFPLTLDQISIQIRLRNEHCGFIYPFLGNIAAISAIDGIITYGTINSFTYRMDTLRRETFFQATQLSTPR